MESNFTRLLGELTIVIILCFPVHYPLEVAGSVSHSIAIVCTIFRLVYRGWTRRLWWEDAWAAVALISDGRTLLARCFIHTIHGPRPGLNLCLVVHITAYSSRTFLTDLSRAARMSLIFCIIRIANHSTSKVQKWITYLIAVSFVCMWLAVVIQKVKLCIFDACHIGTKLVALSQLITDVIADLALVIMPLHFWKNVGLSRSRKILVMSSFGASILITAITIPHSVVLILFSLVADTILVIAHVKAAVSLIVCDLVVIVTFAYRVFSKDTCDLEQSLTSPAIFSTVVTIHDPISMQTRTSFHGQEGTISRQITTGQTKSKPDDTSMVSAEEGTVNRMTEDVKDGEQ
ncbi:hypothetical protein BDR07DRAFT_1367721 [Suillus spraguei]|nr:hypothetical protein BDR07DRAFT_1367721 [Suillus spraguei]